MLKRRNVNIEESPLSEVNKQVKILLASVQLDVYHKVCMCGCFV